MTGSNHNGVYKETVQLGDSEIEIEYGDVVWGDVELPPMALEISGADYHAQLDAVRKFLSWQVRAEAFQREEMQRNEQLVKAANGKLRECLNEDRIELWHSSGLRGCHAQHSSRRDAYTLDRVSVSQVGPGAGGAVAGKAHPT